MQARLYEADFVEEEEGLSFGVGDFEDDRDRCLHRSIRLAPLVHRPRGVVVDAVQIDSLPLHGAGVTKYSKSDLHSVRYLGSSCCF